MLNVVIYHKADFDGIFCREIARRFLPPDTRFIGWDYGDPTPGKELIDGTEQLYILDLSVPDLMDHPNLIWIDHHASAIAKYDCNNNIRGYRIDGVAACRLAWQWFQCCAGTPHNSALPGLLPAKLTFIDRKVAEPRAVRLAGEYDIWDRRDPDAELFQHGLRSRELTSTDWAMLLNSECYQGDQKCELLDSLLHNGKVLQYAKTEENASIIKAAGFTVRFEGLNFLACNHARYNSHLFLAALEPQHDACLGFCWRDGQWVVSLYHAPGMEHHDLSQIAVKWGNKINEATGQEYGGGGHRGACGFRTNKLPFIS